MPLLPYLHPLWQIGALAMGLWTLALGLRMRALRRRRVRHGEASAAGPRSGAAVPPAGRAAASPASVPLIARHVRAGLAFVTALGIGYAGGPATLGLARGEPVFGSGHAWFASLTLALLLFGAGLGWRLRRGDTAFRDLHAFCMGLGFFLALVTGMLGLALLP